MVTLYGWEWFGGVQRFRRENRDYYTLNFGSRSNWRVVSNDKRESEREEREKKTFGLFRRDSAVTPVFLYIRTVHTLNCFWRFQNSNVSLVLGERPNAYRWHIHVPTVHIHGAHTHPWHTHVPTIHLSGTWWYTRTRGTHMWLSHTPIVHTHETHGLVTRMDTWLGYIPVHKYRTYVHTIHIYGTWTCVYDTHVVWSTVSIPPPSQLLSLDPPPSTLRPDEPLSI